MHVIFTHTHTHKLKTFACFHSQNLRFLILFSFLLEHFEVKTSGHNAKSLVILMMVSGLEFFSLTAFATEMF